jgi:N-acetylglucosamine-6-phosphate deacetylase
MAAGNAAAFLGLSRHYGSIATGQRADWVWLDRDLNPRATWIGGSAKTSDRRAAAAE